MDYKSVLKSARENLNGSCKVCKVCNGIACSGEVPGMGGKGTGVAFTENIKSLEKVKINMRVLHNVKNPDTSVEMFGKKMKAPIFAAPVSGTTLNMGGKYTEKEYISWVIEGCLKAGIYPMVGDTAIETFLTDNLEVLKDCINKFRKRLGHNKVDEYINLLEEGKYEELVEKYLVEYYDPLYMHSVDKYKYNEVINFDNVDVAVEEVIKFHKSAMEGAIKC